MLCLSSRYQQSTLSKEEKEDHLAAGLGPIEVSFRRDGDHTHFTRKILEAFPRLGSAGEGYLLLKSAAGGNGIHNLIQIPISSAGYTPNT